MSTKEEQEYKDRNLRGFEGDNYMKAEFQRLAKKHSLKICFETGTYLGGTTKQLSHIFPNVVTVEINKTYFDEAMEFLKECDNVEMNLGDSPITLDMYLQDKKYKTNKSMFFLDGHWWDACPLLDELKTIAKHKIKPVIAIHDFYNPNDPTMGFDTYHDKRFDWSFVEADIINIYGKDNFTYHYNDKAEGARRGVLYVEPK